MAGTDRTRLSKAEAKIDPQAPAVILVQPQLPENIGMVARAMLNCGLTDLRLVAPREGWPDERAWRPASGADLVLDEAKLFETTAEAVSDLQRIYATTARGRDMTKQVVTPVRAADEMRQGVGAGIRSGILFGKESRGLSNDDIALADTILMVPLNPAFSSLNLAQAVLLMGYEWFQSGDRTPPAELQIFPNTRPAEKAELIGFFEHLERELDDCGFLKPVEKRPAMVRNLRNCFQRAQLTEQEIRTLRGVISGLVKFGGKYADKK
ncbi:MAG: RNA methyltransferase [Magnetovibrionaceae bacterium]